MDHQSQQICSTVDEECHIHHIAAVVAGTLGSTVAVDIELVDNIELGPNSNRVRQPPTCKNYNHTRHGLAQHILKTLKTHIKLSKIKGFVTLKWDQT